MNARAALGRRGEAIAARFLEQQGFLIRERNYRCQLGEIDLIATWGDYLVFVEVKTRRAGQGIHPSQSVTLRKQAKVRQVGAYYIAQYPELNRQPRFDVIAVEIDKSEESVEHFPNAF